MNEKRAFICGKIKVFKVLTIPNKRALYSIVNTLALESNRQIKINFDGGDLSSDAGLILIKEFISKLGIDTLLEKAFKTNDPALFRYHSDPKNLLQMIYMIIAGYFEDEDTLNQFLAIGNRGSSYWRRSILSTINAVGYLLLMFL